ncbi:MAG: hypothetical protein AAF640_06740, partial [Pseudomonadota bacterium]
MLSCHRVIWRICAIRLFLGSLAATLFVESSAAATLFGVVSERNSAVAAEAAALFKRRQSDDEIILRTPRQLTSLDDLAIRKHLAQADSVLVAGVFGE